MSIGPRTRLLHNRSPALDCRRARRQPFALTNFNTIEVAGRIGDGDGLEMAWTPTVTVSDGVHEGSVLACPGFLGATAANFHASDDGFGGTLVSIVQAMASMRSSTATSSTVQTLPAMASETFPALPASCLIHKILSAKTRSSDPEQLRPAFAAGSFAGLGGWRVWRSCAAHASVSSTWGGWRVVSRVRCGRWQ